MRHCIRRYSFVQAPTSTGWLGGGVGSGGIAADRPKSAGLMSTLTGSGSGAAANRNAVSTAATQQSGSGGVTNSGANPLSYGSLKNRFLSGTKTKSSFGY